MTSPTSASTRGRLPQDTAQLADLLLSGHAVFTLHNAATVPAVVLDPFAGAGTVGLVARRLQRRFVGIELNPTYAEMARRRIEDDSPMFNRGW